MQTDEQPSLKDRLDQVEQERDTLLGRIQYLEEELRQISDKYADLTGHHNNKQKIKHLVDLKAKNTELIEVSKNNIKKRFSEKCTYLFLECGQS